MPCVSSRGGRGHGRGQSARAAAGAPPGAARSRLALRVSFVLFSRAPSHGGGKQRYGTQ